MLEKRQRGEEQWKQKERRGNETTGRRRRRETRRRLWREVRVERKGAQGRDQHRKRGRRQVTRWREEKDKKEGRRGGSSVWEGDGPTVDMHTARCIVTSVCPVYIICDTQAALTGKYTLCFLTWSLCQIQTEYDSNLETFPENSNPLKPAEQASWRQSNGLLSRITRTDETQGASIFSESVFQQASSQHSWFYLMKIATKVAQSTFSLSSIWSPLQIPGNIYRPFQIKLLNRTNVTSGSSKFNMNSTFYWLLQTHKALCKSNIVSSTKTSLIEGRD